MDESQNPYEAPRTSGVVGPTSGESKSRRRPLLSRALTGLLAVNVAAFTGLVAMLVIGNRLGYWRLRGPTPIPTIFEILLAASLAWIVFAWPVASLVALIYNITLDRGTARWEAKAFLAFLMLFAWAAVFFWLVTR